MHGFGRRDFLKGSAALGSDAKTTMLDFGYSSDALFDNHRRVPTGDALGSTIDHSSFVYRMGRNGEYLGFFSPGTAPERMAAAIRPQRAAGRESARCRSLHSAPAMRHTGPGTAGAKCRFSGFI